MTWGTALAGVASLASSALSSLGAEHSALKQYQYQKKLNALNYKYNVKLINMQNAFNERMMDKSNEFNQSMFDQSTELSNTAHQREVADLRSAGLNPVLSANGGASVVSPLQSAQTSSGNSQLSSQAGMPDIDYLSAVSTANNMYQQNRQVSNELANSQVGRDKMRAEESNIYNQMNINNQNSASEIALRKQQIEEIKSNIQNQRALTKAQVNRMQSEIGLNNSNSAKSKQETINAGYHATELQREANWTKNHPIQSNIQTGVARWSNAFGRLIKPR